VGYRPRPLNPPAPRPGPSTVSSSTAPPSRTATVALLGVVAIWGVNFLAMKQGFESASPLLFNAIRMTLSTGILLWWARHERPDDVRTGWRHLFLLAMLGHVGYQALFVIGLDLTSTGNGALLISSSPIWAAVVASVMGDRLGRLGWAGLLLAFAGTSVITGVREDTGFDADSLLGDLLCVAAAMTWGSFSALARPVTSRMPPARFTGVTMAMSLPVLWVLALTTGPRLTVDGNLFQAVAYAGLLGTGLAYVLFSHGLRHIGAAHATSFINLVPVVTLVVANLAFADPILASQVVGGSLVVAGVTLLQRSRRRRR